MQQTMMQSLNHHNYTIICLVVKPASEDGFPSMPSTL